MAQSTLPEVLSSITNAPEKTTIIVLPQMELGPDPIQIQCGNCRQTVLTKTVPVNGACSFICSIYICFICTCLFWVPLCVDVWKDVRHQCPLCHVHLGTHRKI
ncbi:lipopolysaccharide-induced tumor necrosis factor-alpha factor homolog [Parasteatoda tepidariorum]|uniref:lipopolysaccharide-induced tumor necrosis factor-alpha factor homolog n=1 Tax=Parasteatoda tepidariorum TaxID=114398 RepID=UPI001C71C10D|nr:lipopolysaccharide-induced tumor necrosis factor-alpha factor homolog [Parasteatoda tepidariorum]